MARSARVLGAISTAVAVQLFSTPAGALNLISWVGTGGNNSNACSDPAAPCANFAGALTKTEPSGEIRCVGSLSSGSSFAIDKPITIDCTGVPGATIGINGSLAISINLNEATYPEGEVILRGLTINGLPETFLPAGSDGIRFFGGGGALHVENCRILGFDQQGIDFAPTSSVDLFIRDTIISNNAGGGVAISSAAAAAIVRGSLSNVRLDRNGGVGLSVTKASGGAVAITVEGTQVEKNVVGLRANGASAFIALTSSTITHNTTGLQVLSGGRIFSSGNNTINFNGANGAPTNTVPLK